MASQQLSSRQEKLLRALLDGHQQVVTQFYNRLWRKVYSYFRSRCNAVQLQLLEDCFSDAFLIFLRKIRQEDFQAHNLEGYAFRIVQLKFRDRLKRPSRSVATPPENLPEVTEPGNPPRLTAGQLFEDTSQPRLLHWYRRLSERDQQILNLRIQDYSQEEVAAILNMAHGTVRNINSRLIREAQRVIAQN